MSHAGATGQNGGMGVPTATAVAAYVHAHLGVLLAAAAALVAVGWRPLRGPCRNPA